MLLAIGLKGLLKVDLRWYRNGMAEMRHSIVKGAFNNYVDKKMKVGVREGQLISKFRFSVSKAEVLYNVKNGLPFITSKNSSKILSYENKHSLFFQIF